MFPFSKCVARKKKREEKKFEIAQMSMSNVRFILWIAAQLTHKINLGNQNTKQQQQMGSSKLLDFCAN